MRSVRSFKPIPVEMSIHTYCGFRQKGLPEFWKNTNLVDSEFLISYEINLGECELSRGAHARSKLNDWIQHVYILPVNKSFEIAADL